MCFGHYRQIIFSVTFYELVNFMSILVLQSSWWGRESWLLCLICLPGVLWWLSGSISRCHGVVCSLWLWYFLIILTYYFCDPITGWYLHFRYDFDASRIWSRVWGVGNCWGVCPLCYNEVTSFTFLLTQWIAKTTTMNWQEVEVKEIASTCFIGRFIKRK